MNIFKTIRQLAGLNAEQLAKHLNLSKNAIWAYERGARRPRLSETYRKYYELGKSIGLDITWLKLYDENYDEGMVK